MDRTPEAPPQAAPHREPQNGEPQGRLGSRSVRRLPANQDPRSIMFDPASTVVRALFPPNN